MLELTPEEVEVCLKKGEKNVLGSRNRLDQTLGQEVAQRPRGPARKPVILEGAKWKSCGRSRQGPGLQVVLVC